MLVQEIVEWTIEYRCFVLDRNVAAVSVYWRDGKLAKSADGEWRATEAELNEASEFCTRMLRDRSVAIPDAVVLDVGIIKDRGWAAVECNAAFASGLYGCDPAAVLGVLRRTCVLRDATVPGATERSVPNNS